MSEKQRPVIDIKRELGEAIAACIRADERRAELRNELAEATAIAYAGVVCFIGWNGEGLPPHEVVPLSRLTNSHSNCGFNFGMSDDSTVWIAMNSDRPVPIGIEEKESISLPIGRTCVFRTREEAEQWIREATVFIAAEQRTGIPMHAVVEADSSKRTLH